MATAHLVVGAKGGIGKTFVSWLITQKLNELFAASKKGNGKKVQCIDLDPASHSLSGFKSLGAIEIPVLNQEAQVNKRQFDAFIEKVFKSPDPDATFVIDTGSNVYPTLMSYIVSMEICELFRQNNHKLLIHSIIAGGAHLKQTIGAFAQMCSQLPDYASVALWENPMTGKVAVDGLELKKEKLCPKPGMIKKHFKLKSPATDAQPLFNLMLENGWTFSECIEKCNGNIDGLVFLDSTRLMRAKAEYFKSAEGIANDWDETPLAKE